MLIKCRSCKRYVRLFAKACPFCGINDPDLRHWHIVAAAIVVAFMLGWLWWL